MVYKVGDKVQIKKGLELHRKHLEGKTATISHIEKDVLGMDYYRLAEDKRDLPWDKAMFESLVERNGKTYPYKIGDRVILKGKNRRATITDLKYNSWGNLSYYIKIDNDKDISIDYPTELLLPYERSDEEETKPQYEDKLKLDSTKIVREYWSEYTRIFIEIYDDEPNECVFTHLYTLEGHRQKGYGRRALTEAEEIAMELGCNVAYLKVETDSWMHQWYLRMGYKWHSNINKEYTWLTKNLTDIEKNRNVQRPMRRADQ